MGLSLTDLLLLSRATRDLPRGAATFLGVPEISCSHTALRSALVRTEPGGNWPAFLTRHDRKPLAMSELAMWLNLSEYETLDVSDYEGATHEFDLNTDQFSQDLHSTSSLIVDAGTLEHVFNLSNALDQLQKKLAVGGVIVHLNPGNGFFEHGFYQISPTLYRNYYSQAGYRLEMMGFYKSSPSRGLLTDITFLRAGRDLYRVPGGPKFAAKMGRVTTFFVARKISETSKPVLSLVQDFYSGLHTKNSGTLIETSSPSEAVLSREKIYWDAIYVMSEVLGRFPADGRAAILRKILLVYSDKFYRLRGLVSRAGLKAFSALGFHYFLSLFRRRD